MLEDGENELTNAMRAIISRCPKKLLDLDKDIEKYTQKIEHFCQQSPVCERMMKLSGVGPIIASAVDATMGNPTHFKNGRHFTAFLGLVLKEHSSGGKQCFMSISKRGELHTQFTDTWWPAVVKNSGKKTDYLNCWIQRLHKERGYNKAAVAVANKNARPMWAIRAYDDKYVDHLKLCA